MRPSRLVLSALSALLLGGCAVDPASRSAGTRAATAPPEPVNCIRNTGTRIAPADGRCLPYPGHVFTREDLQHTGEIDVEQALDRLLP